MARKADLAMVLLLRTSYVFYSRYLLEKASSTHTAHTAKRRTRTHQ